MKRVFLCFLCQQSGWIHFSVLAIGKKLVCLILKDKAFMFSRWPIKLFQILILNGIGHTSFYFGTIVQAWGNVKYIWVGGKISSKLFSVHFFLAWSFTALLAFHSLHSLWQGFLFHSNFNLRWHLYINQSRQTVASGMAIKTVCLL